MAAPRTRRTEAELLKSDLLPLPALFSAARTGPPTTTAQRRSKAETRQMREANGAVAVVKAPRTASEATIVMRLLLRNYGAEAHVFFRNELPATVGDGSAWRGAGTQVWLLVREADSAPIATLVWRWLPGANFGEALFSTTMECHRRLGYGAELGRAWLNFLRAKGATGAAVSSVGYGSPDSGYVTTGAVTLSYGIVYWSSLGLVLYPRTALHFPALSGCMMQFHDTRIHALIF